MCLMLNDIQKWFGSVIKAPLSEQQRSKALPASVPDYIKASPTLSPFERIEIYNQQHWWRFFHILQDQFPLLLRLFGPHDFNMQLVTPYLAAYPSRSWALCRLGEHMVKWIRNCYKEEDRRLVLEAAKLDRTFHQGFFTFSEPLITSEPLTTKFFLQPHVALFRYNKPFLSFRSAMIQEKPEYWLDHDFPPLEKGPMHYYVIYKGSSGAMFWQEIEPAQYRLLRAFKKGSYLEEACALLTEGSYYPLQEWFKEWTEKKLLATPSFPKRKQKR